MTLQEPLFLLVLLVAPVAVVLYLRRERRGSAGRAAFTSPALLPAVAPVAPRWRRHLPLGVYLLALVVLAVALARPQVARSVPVENARIVLVLDQSGSMASEDVQPNRLAAAKRAIGDFVARVPKEVQIGGVVYNQDPRVLEAPTTDKAAVTEAFAAVEPAGSTATGDALKLAVRVARPPTRPGERPAPAAVVLLSDGKSVRGSDPLEAAREAARLKIPVYTVALGTPQGRIPRAGGGTVPVPPDPVTLARIAEISDGEAYEVEGAERLTEVYERLGRSLTRKKEQRQITAGFAGGGLALLVIGAGMSLWWFGRVP